MTLTAKKCIPCDEGMPRMVAAEVQRLISQIPGWSVSPDNRRLQRRFTFADFRCALVFVNAMGKLAEAQGHHPDFAVHYNVVDVTLWTHVIDGLCENDFIVAAKINQISV